MCVSTFWMKKQSLKNLSDLHLTASSGPLKRLVGQCRTKWPITLGQITIVEGLVIYVYIVDWLIYTSLLYDSTDNNKPWRLKLNLEPPPQKKMKKMLQFSDM